MGSKDIRDSEVCMSSWTRGSGVRSETSEKKGICRNMKSIPCRLLVLRFSHSNKAVKGKTKKGSCGLRPLNETFRWELVNTAGTCLRSLSWQMATCRCSPNNLGLPEQSGRVPCHQSKPRAKTQNKTENLIWFLKLVTHSEICANRLWSGENCALASLWCQLEQAYRV